MHIDTKLAEYDFVKQVVTFCQDNNINLILKYNDGRLKFFDTNNFEITPLNFYEYKRNIKEIN